MRDLKFYSEDLVPELMENNSTCHLGPCTLSPSYKENHMTLVLPHKLQDLACLRVLLANNKFIP